MSEVVQYTLQSALQYPDKVKNYILNELSNKNMTTNKQLEKKISNNPKLILLPKNNHRQDDELVSNALYYCIEQNNDVIKIIEDLEFNQDYKYSILYTIEGLDIKNISKAIKNQDIIDYNSIEGFESLYPIIMKPSYREIDGCIYLKFNITISLTDNVEKQDLKKRYPLLLIIYPKDNIVEIRFDSLQSIFQQSSIHFPLEVAAWGRRFLNVKLEPLDMDEISYHIINSGDEKEIGVIGQFMKLTSGGTAAIDVGKSTEMVLPFLGELDNIMIQYEKEFNDAPVLKKVFEDFILEKKEGSEIPKFKILFKELAIEEKLTFNYQNLEVCLIQHMYSSKSSNFGKGRLDYVTNYFINIRRLLSSNGLDESAATEVY